MILTNVRAHRREISQAVGPDPHSDERVGARSTERIEEGAAIGQDDVIDNQPGISDVVGSRQSGVGGTDVRPRQRQRPPTPDSLLTD